MERPFSISAGGEKSNDQCNCRCQPEGRRRQDHNLRQSRHRAGAGRKKGAASGQRPAGFPDHQFRQSPA